MWRFVWAVSFSLVTFSHNLSRATKSIRFHFAENYCDMLQELNRNKSRVCKTICCCNDASFALRAPGQNMICLFDAIERHRSSFIFYHLNDSNCIKYHSTKFIHLISRDTNTFDATQLFMHEKKIIMVRFITNRCLMTLVHIIMSSLSLEAV